MLLSSTAEGTSEPACYILPITNARDRPRLGCLYCLSQRQCGLADLFGNDGKTCQTCSSKARGNSNICGVTAACYYDPADPRMVVTRVEREPSPIQIDLEPGAEIHRRQIDGDADVTEIAERRRRAMRNALAS